MQHDVSEKKKVHHLEKVESDQEPIAKLLHFGMDRRLCFQSRFCSKP